MSKLFVDAAACGDLDGVRELLLDSSITAADINAVDRDGRSAFHYACLNDDARLLSVLLPDPRVDVLLRSRRGDTGLHMASLYSSLEVLRLLFEDGRSDLTLTNNYGETPLHLCAGSGDKGAAKTATLLLEHEAPLAVADSYGRGPLDVARDNGEGATVAVLEAYLAAHPELEPEVSALSETHRARSAAPVESDAANLAAKSAIFGQLGGVKLKKTTTTVKTMFRAGEGSTTRAATGAGTQGSDGRRALSKTVDFPGDVEEIRGHLANPTVIDPAGADAYGLTALHKFASWNKVELLEMLLPHLTAEQISATDPEGKTALHWAVEMASVGAVKALIAAGADASARDGKGRTVGEILDAAEPSGIIDRLKAALE